MQSYVSMSVLLAWLMRGERIDLPIGSAIFLSFSGVLVLGFDPIVLDNPLSVFLMLLSALALALGTVWMRAMEGVDAIALQAWSAWLGLPALLLWSALVEPNAWQAGWQAWAGVAWAALVASLLGHSLFFRLVQRHPVAQVAPYLLMAPIVAILLGVLVWGDRPGPRLWFGGLMVLGGVFAIALRMLARNRVLAIDPEGI